MRNSILLFLLYSLSLGAKEVELKTTVTDVTVFQSGAQVNRSGETMIPAGEHEIVINDATALLKNESIQVKGEGDFIILSVNHEVALDDVNNEKTKWIELEAKQKELMKRMEELSVKIQVLNAAEAEIMNLQQISTRTKGVTVEQIAKAEDAVRIKLAEIKNEKLKHSRLILDLFDQHKTITQHLVALKTPKQSLRYKIVIKVLAKAEVKGKFSISYVVPNARWFPTYDLRVKSVSDPMVIEYKANVSQESGEDWNNIRLKLSTGDPSRSSDKPKIDAWWLYLNQGYIQPNPQNNFYKYTDARFTHVKGVIINSETGAAIPWCTVMVPGMNIGATADGDGNFSLVLPVNATQLKVYSVGFNTQTIGISSADLTVKMVKKNLPLNQVVKTDYEKQLMTVQSPTFITDYEGQLLSLDVPVDPIYQDDMKKELYDLNSMDVNGTMNISSSAPLQYQWSSSGDMKQMKEFNSYLSLSPTTTKTLNIVSTEFSIDEKYSIPSDPKSISVSIQNITANPTYQYYCAPRFDKDVFLTAQLVNWEQYNLLEGQANVFFEGTFIGNTFFDTRYLVDTLEISLGRDKGIKVERKKSKDYSKHLVLGSDNIAYREWDITARNAKQQPVDIIIEDQFPVSADSRIDVTQEEKSDGKLDDKTGIISWNFKIEPSSTKSLVLKYKVKYPKGSFIGLD